MIRSTLLDRRVLRLFAAAALLAAATHPALAQPAPDPFRGLYRETISDPPAPAKAASNPLARSPAPTVVRNGYVSVQVNVDAQGDNIVGDAANEPSIAVRPGHPEQMVIGWRQFDTTASNFRQAGWGYSHDGGATWTFPGVLEPGAFRSDPVLDFDAEGEIFYQSLEVVGSSGPDLFLTDVWRSQDAGVTWSPPVPAFGGDKNWMAIDRTGGSGHGNVYATWGINPLNIRPCVGTQCCDTQVPLCCQDSVCCNNTICADFKSNTWSKDNGASFPRAFDFDPDDLLRMWLGWTTIAVGPDGRVYFAGQGQDVANGGTSLTPGPIHIERSDDLELPTTVEPTFTLSQVRMGGVTGFQEAPNPAGLLGQVEIDVDHSDGPHRGYVYVLTTIMPDTGGDPSEIYIIRSTDGGATWTEPIRVNDDPAGNWQWFGTQSVSPDGRIDAVWNDNRASGDASVTETYYAYSWDAGDTWHGQIPISPAWNSHLGWPNQNKIGDYYDMVSDETGADLAYAATFNGEQDVYYARIYPDCDGNGVSDVTDLAGDAAHDLDGNRILDRCQGLVLGPPRPGLAGRDNTFEAAGQIDPGEGVRFFWSDREGSGAVPGCPGVSLGIERPRRLGQEAGVPAGGYAATDARVAAGFAGRTLYYQALNVDQCMVSNVVAFDYPPRWATGNVEKD